MTSMITAIRYYALLGVLLLGSSLFSTVSFSADWQYTVRPGDSIWVICDEYTQYPNCWRELPDYNQIANPKNLSIGHQIKIPAAWLKQVPLAALVGANCSMMAG